jgi:hypothetical protein
MATSKSSSNRSDKSKQGFAGMDEDKRKEAASKGGSASKKDDSQSETASQANASQTKTEADEGLDESQELDELLELMEGDITELDSDEAVELIDEWHEILSESDDAGLKEIGKGLKQLKKALSASKTKPADIAEALTSLGEKTNEYANEAQRGYKTKLHTLGKALSKAGKTLEEQE